MKVIVLAVRAPFSRIFKGYHISRETFDIKYFFSCTFVLRISYKKSCREGPSERH